MGMPLAGPAVWIAGALLCAGASGQPPCDKHLDQGDSAYARWDNGEALRWFAAAVDQCPARYEPLMKMTRALIDLGEDKTAGESAGLYEKALQAADTLQRRFPDSVQSYFLKATAAGNLALLQSGGRKLALGRIAEQNAKRSIELSPSFAPAYIVLGSFYREVAAAGVWERIVARLFWGGMPGGALGDAANALQKALALSPCNVYGLLELARTEIALDSAATARRLLQEMQNCPPVWHLDNRLKDEGRRLLDSLRR